MKIFRLLIIFILCSVTLPLTLKANPDTPKLTLTAHATIRKPSDELQLKIGVVNMGERAESTLSENSEKMQMVIDSLEAIGLTKDEYETGQFSIHPTYTPYPHNPPADWKPSINGYEVSNFITIHTEKLELAGKIIDVANRAGANSISDICFGLHNPRLYWSEALSAAAANAIQDAQAIALASSVQLMRVLSITLDNTRVVAPHINAAYLSKAMSSETAPPIEPGEVTLTAQITLIYEIGPLGKHKK